MRAILTFHSIDESGSILSYPMSAFARLMTSIAESGVPVIELDQLQSSATGVVITFDDGMQSVLTAALPVLRDLGFPAHLFLTTGAVGSTNSWPTQPATAPCLPMLNWDEVDKCVEAGLRIESHTHTHPNLRDISTGQVMEEFDIADHEIATRTGRFPRHFAYPYGHFDDRVAEIVRKRYAFAVTTRLAFLSDRTHDPATLPRLDSYYLTGRIERSNLFGRNTRTYLSARRGLRAIRAALL